MQMVQMSGRSAKGQYVGLFCAASFPVCVFPDDIVVTLVWVRVSVAVLVLVKVPVLG